MEHPSRTLQSYVMNLLLYNNIWSSNFSNYINMSNGHSFFFLSIFRDHRIGALMAERRKIKPWFIWKLWSCWEIALGLAIWKLCFGDWSWSCPLNRASIFWLSYYLAQQVLLLNSTVVWTNLFQAKLQTQSLMPLYNYFSPLYPQWHKKCHGDTFNWSHRGANEKGTITL